MKPALLWGIPRKSARYLHFLDPPPSGHYPSHRPVARRHDAKFLRKAMFHGTRPGWIEVIAGVMFSGKSEELIRRVRRAVIARKQVQVFKSHLDARYAGLYNVTTHDGLTVEAEPVDSAEEVIARRPAGTEVFAVGEDKVLDDGIVEFSD